MDRDDVIDVLNDIAVLLEVKGENPFKARAYTNAARALEQLTGSLRDYVEQERLGEIKGVGEALRSKIAELVRTGRLEYYEKLKASLPEGLPALLELPGLGPKKVRALFENLGVSSVEELESACREGRVAGLSGFGEKTQQKILEGIEFHRRYASKFRLSDAWETSEPILEWLRGHPDVTRCSGAGSLRRCREVIGDLDFVVSSREPERVIADFTGRDGVEKVLAQGATKASVVLAGGMQADLRVVADDEYPFALAYFTGSKEHNVVMRQRAIERGLRLNEYGLFRSDEETRDPKLRVACRSEEEIYEALGLQYVPPEMREDRGEFALAEEGKVPRLLEWTQLRGSLHNHTNWSDGRDDLETLARHLIGLGLDYWGVTDHSRSSFQAHGLDATRLRRQIREVRDWNRRLEDEGETFRFLTGSEVDVLKGGELDFPDDLLAELDVVVASVHAGFSKDSAEMTRRLVRAAENPMVHMLGHPTGRLLLEREPYPVDMEAVIEACARSGTWIELNASPYRLDMDWRLWSGARDAGVRCVINCDAHRLDQAAYLRFGAGVARKAGLRAADVVNTMPLERLREALAAKRGG